MSHFYWFLFAFPNHFSFILNCFWGTCFLLEFMKEYLTLYPIKGGNHSAFGNSEKGRIKTPSFSCFP